MPGVLRAHEAQEAKEPQKPEGLRSQVDKKKGLQE